ncbi:MAG: hypothetical protein PUB94_02830 [Oscillospiraceae bacterium]|nr:hypothetical protein [Oscillospiraceae bacterium]
MNRTVKIIVSIVLCVWIFAMGIELGAYRERKAINTSIMSNANTTQSQLTTTPTVALSSTEPTQATSAPSQADTSSTGTASTTKQSKPDSSASKKPETKEEIAKAFNDAMNKTKNMKQNCNAKKTTNVQITVVDCSVPRLTSMVNKIVNGFTGEKSTDYAFVNGATAEGQTILSELPPSNKETSITAAGISAASCDPYGDGGYKISITIVPETGTLDTPPANHSVAVGYLDVNSLGLSGVNITKADMTYPGSTVTICVNKDGLLDKYDCKFPMSGSGEAKIIGLTGSASFEGGMDESWTFTWQ